MHLIRDHQRILLSTIAADDRRSLAWAAAFLALALAALSAVFLGMGAPVMNGRPWDTPCLLDGAWRVVNGQVPHRDFFSHLGALPYYVTALGMKLGHPGVGSLTFGTVVLMVGLSGVAFGLAARRTSALYAWLLGVYVALLVITPRPLGDPYFFNDYAMQYNRMGEALVGIFFIAAFLSPARVATAGTAGLEGLCLALIAGGLWFVKLNYFVVSVGFAVVALALRCLNWRTALVWAAAVPALVLFFFWITGIPPHSMLDDFRVMGAAQSYGERLRGMAVQTVKGLAFLPLLLLLAWEGARGQPRTRANGSASACVWLVPLVAFGGAILLAASNCGREELPLLGFAALYLAELIRRQPPTPGSESFFSVVRQAGTCVLLLVTFLTTLGPDLKAVRHLTNQALKRDFLPGGALDTTPLHDFRMAASGTQNVASRAYLAELTEAIELVRRHARPDMRLLVGLFTNPYSVALQLPPARGGSVAWAENVFNRRSHPDWVRLVGDATHILTVRGRAFLNECYGAELGAYGLRTIEATAHFELIELGRPAQP